MTMALLLIALPLSAKGCVSVTVQCHSEQLEQDQEVDVVKVAWPLSLHATPDGLGTEVTFNEDSEVKATKVLKKKGEWVQRWKITGQM
jgi:hypothetical protein